VEENPEAEGHVLSALKEYHTLTEQEIRGNKFLSEYGYRSNEFCTNIPWNVVALSVVSFLCSNRQFPFFNGVSGKV